MRVTFWGVRGSIAKPGPATLRYGGNTSCVEVSSAGGTTIVLDCGTGAHELGQSLVARGRALRGTLLIGHTHWDHIQGIPFFAPLFVKGAEWEIMGPKGLGSSLRDTLGGQMEYTYFPIALDQFGATIGYHDLVEGTIEIGDIRVTTHYLNHPALTLAYRLECDGASVVYACDHEPHVRASADGGTSLEGADLRHVAFCAGADLLIHDAQYTALEYPEKVGWGHSTVEYATSVAVLARAGRLALTHHDPLRDDGAVDAVLAIARASLPADVPVPQVFAAHEGLTLDLVADEPAHKATVTTFEARTHISSALVDRPVLVGVADVETNAAIVEAIRAEGIAVAAAADLASAREALEEERPSLVILEHDPPRLDAIAHVRALRTESPVETPIVVIADREDPRGADAGVTDWLIRPFGSGYARTKLRAWILREACRWIRARIPDDEAERLAALRDLHVLDSAPDPRFDRITRLVASSLDVPISMVTFVDDTRQWFKARVGIDVCETDRDVSFCAHVVDARTPMIVPDTHRDPRFADNPLVIGPPRIRFYAGAPLIVSDGSCIGALCAIDVRPRDFGPHEIAQLEDLRDLVLRELHVGAPPMAAT